MKSTRGSLLPQLPEVLEKERRALVGHRSWKIIKDLSGLCRPFMHTITVLDVVRDSIGSGLSLEILARLQ
jgi:hypothetical protein